MVEAILDWWQPEGVTLPELSMPFPTIWFEQLSSVSAYGTKLAI